MSLMFASSVRLILCCYLIQFIKDSFCATRNTIHSYLLFVPASNSIAQQRTTRDYVWVRIKLACDVAGRYIMLDKIPINLIKVQLSHIQ